MGRVNALTAYEAMLHLASPKWIAEVFGYAVRR